MRKYLDLGSRSLRNKDVFTLCKTTLKNNAALRFLYLDCNEIGNAGARYLARVLMTNNALETLFLQSNNIGRAGVRALSRAMAYNCTLTHMVLDENPWDRFAHGSNACDNQVRFIHKRCFQNVFLGQRRVIFERNIVIAYRYALALQRTLNCAHATRIWADVHMTARLITERFICF